MMKLLASFATAAAMLLASTAVPAFSQTVKADLADPVVAIAARLRSDPRERAKAGATIEAFLLSPDSAGKSFVGSDADRAALGAVAREWAVKADAGQLAALVFAAEAGSVPEPRLRRALAAWTGSAQIRKENEKMAAVAFLTEAHAQAAKLLSDPRTRQDISAAVDSSAVVPGGPAALERARRLRERGAGPGAGVFGTDRKVQDLGGEPGGAGDPLRSSSILQNADATGAGEADSRRSSTGLVAKAAAATPGAQLPRSQGRPDGIAVPAPIGAGNGATTVAGQAPASTATPDDGRVVPKEVSAWERVKESVTSPLSDAYGFTFEGLEAAPVSFREAGPAIAYIGKTQAGGFSKVILYGHGAPGYMTVGEWGGDAGEISSLLKGKMKNGALLDLNGCNTSSIGGSSINPARGLSGLTRRVMYFSVPYLTGGDRSDSWREQLENDWDSDLARDVSLKLAGVKVCGFRTFGLVADRIPVVGTLLGRREATDSNAIGGTKACFINGKEVK